MLRKFDTNKLYTCPPHLYTVATLPWEIQKSHFSRVLFIHIPDYLRYLRRKQTFIPLSPHLKNVTALPCKMQNFFDLTEGNVVFLQTLVALRRTGCDVRQLECQASNVTASVQSDHLLHGYMLPVFFATNQLHSPPRCGEIQPMLQQGASATHLYCGFILDTSTIAACPRRGNLPG